MRSTVIGIMAAAICAALHAQNTFQLIRSRSGPSGKVVGGSSLQIDDVRTRFVYPQDKSFVVHFEWNGPPGDHVLTGYWRNPEGNVAEISPDVHMQTTAREFGCYWQYTLRAGMPSGVWNLEIRIDGRPAGSHAFEIISPELPKPAEPPPAPAPPPSLDQIYQRVVPSLVWIHKLDPSGRRFDTSSGFIFAADRVATAFQAIDSATQLQIEFADGRVIVTDRISAFHRIEDWAIIHVPTNTVQPLAHGDPADLKIGERAVTFNVESERVRALGGIDIGGKSSTAPFGPRIAFAPGLISSTAGAPVLTPKGDVAAVIGGSRLPGSRLPSVGTRWLGHYLPGTQTEAVPITTLQNGKDGASPTTLKEMATAGSLTPAMTLVDELIYAGTTKSLPRNPNMPFGADVTEFSRKDAAVFVYSLWQRRGKPGKGVLTGTISDLMNRPIITIKPVKVDFLYDLPTRTSVSFSPVTLQVGVYRIDLKMDERVCWRGYIRIIE